MSVVLPDSFFEEEAGSENDEEESFDGYTAEGPLLGRPAVDRSRSSSLDTPPVPSKRKQSLPGVPHALQIPPEIVESSTPGEMLRFTRKREDIVGTPEYLSPEILLGQDHSFAVDWWAIGILLFEFLVGLPPFTGDTPESVFEHILSAPIPWDRGEEAGIDISEEARDLIKGLLARHPKKRLGSNGSSEVKHHRFFAQTKWNSVTQEIPQFVPTFDDDADTSYFDPHKERHPSLIMLDDHDPLGTEPTSEEMVKASMDLDSQQEQEPMSLDFKEFDFTHPRFLHKKSSSFDQSTVDSLQEDKDSE